MRVLNLRTAALALVAGIGLGGCAYGPYGGLGVGYGNSGYNDPYYDRYGYGDGYGYGYDPYGSSYGYGPYGSSYGYGYSPYGGYGMPYYGWNDGFYYPGSGYYVYDQYRRPYRWTDAQRRYWEWRQKGSRPSTSSTGKILQNWADFQNGPQASTSTVRQQSVSRTTRNRPTIDRELRAQQRAQQQQIRTDRQQVRTERQQVRAERQVVRAERKQVRESSRSQAREDRLEEARERRRGKKAD